MARIKGVPKNKASLTIRLAYRMARRRLGNIPEPLTVVAHHPTLAKGYGAYEFALEKSRRVEAKLKALASLKAATLIGCPF